MFYHRILTNIELSIVNASLPLFLIVTSATTNVPLAFVGAIDDQLIS